MRAQFLKKNVYGRFLYEPMNELASSFCKLLGRKSLSDRHITDLEKVPLDFEIEIKHAQFRAVWEVQEDKV